MFKYLLLTATLLAFPVMGQAQQAADATRDLWDTAFLKKRPAAKKPAVKTRPVRYNVVGNRTLPSAGTARGPAVVGVTVWRLRPSEKTDDEEVRQLLHQQGEWTPERVGGGMPLSEGSKVQLTIESPRTGYLYVFDREIYADKTYGDPYLIFPTLSINGGDNKVSAGKMIEIPSMEDKPPYYTLKRSRPDHQGESLTVIVSDKPLAELRIGRHALKVSTQEFSSYEAKWGAMTEQLELESGAGTAMTRAEKAAAAGKILTSDDSPPQTIYRVLARPKQPLFLTIPLPIESRP